MNKKHIKADNLDDILVELAIYWLRNDAQVLADHGATEKELMDYLNGPLKDNVNDWMREQRAVIARSAEAASLKAEVQRCIG